MGPRFRWWTSIESEGEIIMINRLIKLLNQCGLDGYLINQENRETYQLFFVKDQIETVRGGSFTEAEITVYLNHDGFLGDSKFKVFASSSDEEIIATIKEAKAKALSINNKPYNLVAKDILEDDNHDDRSLKEIAKDISNAIFSVKGHERSKLNATEVFVNRINKRVVNSLGLDKSSHSYKFMIETIPTYDSNNESVEIYAQHNFSIFSRKEIEEYIAEKLFEVEARGNVKKEKLPANMNVLLREEEVETVLSEFVYQLTYSSLFNQRNALNVGDKVQEEGDCDLLTLTMRGNIEGCSESALFDNDGSSFKDKVIIDKGVVKGFYGGNRFSQYVGQENTGSLELSELALGTLSKDGLKNEEYLECLQFSGIQCDYLNDYVGGEVRLAIWHKNGQKIPVSGFSISASLKEMLNHARLANYDVHSPSYHGPKFIYFRNMNVL